MLATGALTHDALPILTRMLRAAFFALVGVAFFTHWVVTDPSFEGPINTEWTHVLAFSALLLTLAVTLPVYGWMVGGRWVFRLSLVAGAGAALGSVANIFEDGFAIGWVFFVFILGTAIVNLALLGMTVVIARTQRGVYRLLALIPAGTVAAIIFNVLAGGIIMLVTWLIAAALALRTRAAVGAAPPTT